MQKNNYFNLINIYLEREGDFMYRKEKIKINVFYNDSGINILDVFRQDFKDFFEQYLREKVL